MLREPNMSGRNPVRRGGRGGRGYRNNGYRNNNGLSLLRLNEQQNPTGVWEWHYATSR